MRCGLLKVVWLISNGIVAYRLWPVLYLRHENGLIASIRLNSKAIDLVDDIHPELAMSVAVVGVVDLLAEDLVVEGVVEGQRKDLIEYLQDLDFEVGGVYGGEDLIEHILHVLKVALVERLQPPDLHPVLN